MITQIIGFFDLVVSKDQKVEFDNLIWPDGNPNSKLTDQDLAKIRNISKLLLENGLTSAKLKTAADIANLTKEKLEAGRKSERNEFVEFSTAEDTDSDGIDDYDESLPGPDGNPIGDKDDPNFFPTQEQIDAGTPP